MNMTNKHKNKVEIQNADGLDFFFSTQLCSHMQNLRAEKIISIVPNSQLYPTLEDSDNVRIEPQ